MFLIPLIYSKVIPEGEISMAQLLTLEVRVFLAKIALRVNDHFSKLPQHLPDNKQVSWWTYRLHMPL